MQAGPTEQKWRNLGAAERLYRTTPPVLDHWTFSPLGRYGLAIEEEEVNPENENTDDATHRYFICNLETGTWTEYKSNTGIFKTLMCDYWLREDKLVVTDFSETSSCLRQHILELNHSTKEVNCNITRSYRWNVDETHRNKGSDAYPVDYKGEAYIAVTGYSDEELEWITCRLLPFNPLSLKPPLELVISTDAIRNTIANDARFFQKLQPFCHGSLLVFRLFEGTDESDYPFPNEFLTIDLKKVQLDRDGVARIGMPEASLGLLKLQALNFDPKSNEVCHYAVKNAEYITFCYQWEGDKSLDSEPKECEVYIVNLRESSIVRMSFAMTREDWLTIHPSGALLHWRRSAAGLLQCLNRPRPLCRPPSLMNFSKQRLLMTDSHKSDDKFINGLLFG